MFPGSDLDQLYDCSLMRTYDMYSGSCPKEDRRMLARAPRMRLDNEEIRYKALSTHTNHRERQATPFISFTRSPVKLRNLANFRSSRPNRGGQRIVVIDPRIRMNLGLPVLSYREEAARYNIQPSYSSDYWQDHYLCLWEVTPEEVVGTWSWEDLRNKENWYQDIIVPALQQHRMNPGLGIIAGNHTDENDDTDPDNKENTSDTSDDTDSDGSANNTASSNSGKEDCDDNHTGQLIKMYGDLSFS